VADTLASTDDAVNNPVQPTPGSDGAEVDVRAATAVAGLAVPNAEAEALVDPAVSRAKFDREIAEYHKLGDQYIERGWWMVKAEFPDVFVVFGTPNVKPPSVVFGALLNFQNYDLWPPSVRLVNPFTQKPYSWAELPTRLPRVVQANVNPALATQLATEGQGMPIQVTELMQSHEPNNPEAVPFLCMPGVREYHHHPGHSGDHWLLHRARGEGTLYFILDQLYRYGVVPVTGYEVELKVHLKQFQFGNLQI
jgi:hypothetical protein